MALKLITPATQLPITVKEARAHLRLDAFDNDDVVEAMIRAAVSYAERFTGRAFMPQTWDYVLDAFPANSGPIEVPLPPLISVAGVFYGGPDDESEFTAFEIDSVSEPGRIYLPNGSSWPTPPDQENVVRVRFTAGYSDNGSPESESVPHDVKAAIKLIVGTFFEHRETIIIGQSVAQMPWSAEQLLRPHRVHMAMA